MQTNWKRIFLIGLIASLSVAALLSIGVLVFSGHFGSLESKILQTTFLVAVCSLIGLANASLLTGSPKSVLGLAGIGFSIGTFLGFFSLIWEIGRGSVWEDREMHKLCGSLLVLAISTAHSSLLLGYVAVEKDLIRHARSLTLFFIGVVALLVLIAIFTNERPMPDLFNRTIGVFAVLDVLGTLVTPLLKWVLPKDPA